MGQATLVATPVKASESNHAYLRAEFSRIRLLMQRKVGWLRKHWQQDPLGNHHGVVISEMQADRLLRGDDAGEELKFYTEDAQSGAIERALALAEEDLVARRRSMMEQGTPSLPMLARYFGLSDFERDSLLLCFAVEEDPGLATLCAYIQDDIQARHVTAQLARSLLGAGGETDSMRAAVLSSAPLRRFHLLTLTNGHVLRIDDRVTDYLRGMNRMDEGVMRLLRPLTRGPVAGAHRDAVDRLIGWAEAAAGHSWPAIHLTGAANSGKEAVTAEFCARAGLHLFALDPSRIPTNDTERHHLLHLIERESILSRLALYIDLTEVDGTDRLLSETTRDWIERCGCVLFVAARERRLFQRQMLSIEIPKLDAAAQRQVWVKSLEGIGNCVDGELDAIVQQFDLEPYAIPQAVTAAAARAATRTAAARVVRADDLWQACREQVGWQFGSLAQRLTPTYEWDDIVLPADLMRQLREVAEQVSARSQVYESWGFGARLPRGRGISALFSGPSGTGKTMAAEILANHLRLDLYRIDLAGVVSKYIGETEKNLRGVFDAAEQSGAILFFDEADSLFGKRSEVKDSHDRYANIEVNYLLQRMEDYRGLAILCTNRRSALDRAFLRRLRFVVEFPFPDSENRRLIWAKVFPKAAPLAQLDLDALSRMEIAGGHIRNIALNAAFLAAGEKAEIQMGHVLHAARREYAKIDKLLTEAEFGSHYRLMKT
jgi:hypothetical protein